MKYRQRILLKRDKSRIQEMKEEAENRKRESKKQREKRHILCVCMGVFVREKRQTKEVINRWRKIIFCVCLRERE